MAHGSRRLTLDQVEEIRASGKPYAELANKIEVHQKLDVPGVGYVLTELDVQTIIEALRYTSDWKAAINATEDSDEKA